MIREISNSRRPLLAAIAAIVILVGQSACAASTVSNQEEFKNAVKNAKPGDTIVMADGVWRDFEMLFTGQGTADKPITLTAETRGKVIISGQSNLRLAGEHLVVSGLVFRDGHSPTNTVIAFRRTKGEYANNSRVTEVVIDHFNNPERRETDFWVMLYGKNNRFDHNHIEGKSNNGVTMAVKLDSEESQENHHRIDHNYFGPRPVLGSNGGETLRIGTSHYSLTDSFTTVENNYFDRCDGEVEIISSKSGGNQFRGNVFFESRGTLTLRHGNGNLVENNVFLGNGVDHTGGIRLINKRQTIRNNYMSGLKGYRFGGALVIMNGVPDSPINRYHQVEDSIVEGNTIIESDHIELAAGADAERSAVPITSAFRNNLIVNSTEVDSIAVHDDISGITFEGNVIDGVSKAPSESGFQSASVEMETADNGLSYPVDAAFSDIGADRSLSVLDRDATGVSWYPKPGFGSPFDGGEVRRIEPGNNSIANAVAAASAGDVIELAAGEYVESKIIAFAKPITVRSASDNESRPRIRFERTTLFELQDGASLSLSGLDIDGTLAPDTYGNSVVRTSPYSMLGNYQLLIDDLQVSELNVNHSFHFILVSKNTFASEITITNSGFSNITGHIAALDKQTDDLGIYNAEYISIRDTSFQNVQGSIATVYRGGTDESTFGPHFLLQGSSIDSVGNGKRNKSGASVHLHGVQVATILDNQFSGSQPIRIVETVGEPVTRLSNNEYVETSEPVVTPFN